jgi:hypothetical protein
MNIIIFHRPYASIIKLKQRLQTWSEHAGYSKQHSNNVHMVLNLDTGKISPQDHLVFNDTFSTVYSNGAFNVDVWNSLVTSNLELHDDVLPTVPSTYDFTDSSSTKIPASDPTNPNADILYFIDNLPEQPPSSSILPSLPTEIDHHLPSFSDGPTSSFRSPLTMNQPLSFPEGGRPFSLFTRGSLINVYTNFVSRGRPTFLITRGRPT